MIPILYDTNETAFISNGLGRLRDCISAVVTEGRNDVFELDFEYPVTGANYDLIQVGRIVAVTHDDTGDIEPFDIISYSRPINGIVNFHCVHISYRLSYCTVTGSNINSLADAFTLFETAEPNMPFSFQTDKTSSGYMAAADGKPRTVRELMGGVEGSILDAYGGEYSFNNWIVYLHAARGQDRDFTIRYGVNMLDYNEDYDASGTFSSVIPYWTDGTETVLGDRVDGTGLTITGRGETVPLDVSDKFESKPTKAQVETEAAAYLNANNTTIPKQTIKIEFVRLQDLGYEWLDNLLTCELCDTINVVFPDYNSSGRFKIVKTVWDVLADRFESMELGELSTTLAEALGITNGLGGENGKTTIEQILDRLDHIGTTNSASKTINITSTNVDTYTEGATITLQAGEYIVWAAGSFASNSTEAIRRVQIYNKTTSTSFYTISEWDRYYVAHSLTVPITLTAEATIAVRLSAGVAISGCTTNIKSIRIK